MDCITFRDISLSSEESRDIIEFIAKKRNVNNYEDKLDAELLSAIKEKSRNLAPKKPLKNPKRKISKNLTPKKSFKNIKRKISENLTLKKTLKNIKSKKNKILTLKKSLKNIKSKISENLTPKKPLKNPKSKNKQILTSRNKKRIDIMREFLKDLSYKVSKSELKEIKKNLYKLSANEDYYKPKLTKSGYDGNYTQYESKGDRILSFQEYLAVIEKYLRKLINQYKNEGEWKIQLIAEINFISLKPGSDETRVMYTRSNNEEFMSGSDTDEVIKLLFRSLLQKYQENLQNKMRGSDFEFDDVNLLYYNFNKISLNRGGSYIEPAKWIKDKKSIINPKNNDHKCFQYAVTLALNYDKIDKNHQKISKIRPFIDQYN